MASSPSPLAPLLDALRDVSALLASPGVRGILIGGVAVSILARPRTTRDVDAVVWLPDASDWPAFLALAIEHRLTPRIADPLVFAKRSRVLLLRHAPSSIDIDISFGALPFEEEAIARGTQTKFQSLTLRLASPEDLIVMKAVAHRPRDLGDIESLLDAHPDLDRTRIRKQVEAFSDILEAPEFLLDLDRILASRPILKTRKKTPRKKPAK